MLWTIIMILALEHQAPVKLPDQLGEQSILHPQFFIQDQQLGFIWMGKGSSDQTHLYYAMRQADGGFGPAIQITPQDKAVGSVPLDGFQPPIAVSTSGSLAVAWFDRDYNLQLTVQDENQQWNTYQANEDVPGRKVHRSLADIHFDGKGRLYAVWLDSRSAPPHQEEPADLYIAVQNGDSFRESNLTAHQEASVCGCCKPFLVARGNQLEIAFRNTDEDGFRDIYYLKVKDADKRPTAHFQPCGKQLWKLNGCPMAGGIIVDDAVFWADGSLGHRRIMSYQVDSKDRQVLFDPGPAGGKLNAPRKIWAQEGSWILVSGSKGGNVFTKRGGTWSKLKMEVPSWASAAAFYQGQLWIAGSKGGALKMAQVNPDN